MHKKNKTINSRASKVLVEGLKAIITLVVVGALLNHLFFHFYFQQNLNDGLNKIETIYSSMLKDLASIERNPVFSEYSRTNDAGDFISRHLKIYDIFRIEDNQKRSHLSSFISEYKDMKEDGSVLEKLKSDPRLSEFSTQWFKKLRTYSHWDFYRNPKMYSEINKAHLASGTARISLAATIPVPNISVLQNLAKIHLVKGSNNGKLDDALSDIKHLANLLHSAGNLVTEMIGLSILDIHRSWGQALGATSKNFVTEELTKAYKRVAFGWLGLTWVGWLQGIPEEFIKFAKPKFGICSSAFEMSINSPISFHISLGTQFILEPNTNQFYEQSVAIHRWLLNSCGLESLSGLVGRPSQIQYAGRDRWVYHIPFLRQLGPMSVITIGVPLQSVNIYKK